MYKWHFNQPDIELLKTHLSANPRICKLHTQISNVHMCVVPGLASQVAVIKRVYTSPALQCIHVVDPIVALSENMFFTPGSARHAVKQLHYHHSSVHVHPPPSSKNLLRCWWGSVHWHHWHATHAGSVRSMTLHVSWLKCLVKLPRWLVPISTRSVQSMALSSKTSSPNRPVATKNTSWRETVRLALRLEVHGAIFSSRSQMRSSAIFKWSNPRLTSIWCQLSSQPFPCSTGRSQREPIPKYFLWVVEVYLKDSTCAFCSQREYFFSNCPFNRPSFSIAKS